MAVVSIMVVLMSGQVTPEQMEAVDGIPLSKFPVGLMFKLDTRRWNRA